MDSTMLYQLVLEQLHTGKELINLLPPLASSLNPHSNLATNQMNDQQVFSQIHKSVTKALAAHQSQTQQLLANIQQPSEAEEEMEEEESGDDQNEGQQNDWDPEQQEEEAEEMEGEQEEGQGNQEEPFQQIEEEENEDQMDEDDIGQEELFQGEEDVGLYGQEIDQEEMESYENEGDSQEERQFEEQEKNLHKGKRRNYKQQDEGEDDEGEDLINDQFDHFRELQLQNKEEQPQTSEEKTELQKQIQKLQSKIISKKDWVLRGEVKATQRPLNSLLQHDLQFKTGIRLNQQITPEVNSEIEAMIKQRILDELYDDRVRYQHSHVLREQYSSLKEVSTEKSKLGLGQLYEAEFKNYLGLGQNKNDKLKQEILQSFKEVNFYLDSLSNFNFTPRPTTGTKNEVVISEEKVPINMWKGNNEQPASKIDHKIVSEKEQNNKAKRIKNKRIARQRKKEQDRKKLNKKIEYGGMTKFQAKAMAQRAKNNLNKDNVKYNKSANFFAEMNKEKKGKPNPHIGKLKI